MADIEYVQVHTSCPDKGSAEKISKEIMVRKLSACIQKMPVMSTYSWKGRIEEDEEVLLMIKTTLEKVDDIKALIDQLHPYELPEFWVLRNAGGSRPYLDWISETVG